MQALFVGYWLSYILKKIKLTHLSLRGTKQSRSYACPLSMRRDCFVPRKDKLNYELLLITTKISVANKFINFSPLFFAERYAANPAALPSPDLWPFS